MSWLLAFAGFALLIVLHEAGHFAAAKAVGMRVERFALFFPPLLVRKKVGETEYAIGAVPLGGYVRITGMNPHEEIPPEVEHRAYYKQPAWKRIVVIAAGPAVNIVIALAIFTAYFAIEDEKVYKPTPVVYDVSKDSPADGVLRKGDVLVAVDGKRGSLETLRDQLRTHRCAGAQKDGCAAASPARLTIRRDGREMTVAARPRWSTEVKPARPLLGFQFDQELVRVVPVGAGEALQISVERSWEIAEATVSGIVRLFYDSEARDEVSGVVGSYETTRQTFEFDTSRAVLILGLISLSLAIINLFPFLPLDGGHIFWAVAEKIRGKPIPFSVLERVSVVGFLLVAFLFVTGLTNDIDRLSGEGFGVR